LRGFTFPRNEAEVTQVDKNAGALAGYENRILSVYGVREQDKTTGKAEIPERRGNDAFADTLALQPLYDKAHGEKRLSGETYYNPETVLLHYLALLTDFRNFRPALQPAYTADIDQPGPKAVMQPVF
jgi:hypothetical protein